MHEETPKTSSPWKRLSSRFDGIEVEPFVKPETVAEFLGIDAETVVRLVKDGLIPGHPLRVLGRRMHWRFLLSEVKAVMLDRELKHVRKA